MNRAQRELLAAGAASALVKEIATNWGFADMGRFAVEYKWLFRESPSETLARKASNPSARLADILGRASKH